MQRLASVTLLVCLAMQVGCATLNKAGAQVEESTEERVKGCEYIGMVEGSSGWGGMAGVPAVRGAMAELMNNAAKKGATHIVYPEQPTHRWAGQLVRARAYRCPASQPAVGATK